MYMYLYMTYSTYYSTVEYKYRICTKHGYCIHRVRYVLHTQNMVAWYIVEYVHNITSVYSIYSMRIYSGSVQNNISGSTKKNIGRSTQHSINVDVNTSCTSVCVSLSLSCHDGGTISEVPIKQWSSLCTGPQVYCSTCVRCTCELRTKITMVKVLRRKSTGWRRLWNTRTWLPSTSQTHSICMEGYTAVLNQACILVMLQIMVESTGTIAQ